jgi:hypothetical protein
MSDKEKLDIACRFLHQAIKKNMVLVSDDEYKKRWRDFALRGSVQSRKAKVLR